MARQLECPDCGYVMTYNDEEKAWECPRCDAEAESAAKEEDRDDC